VDSAEIQKWEERWNQTGLPVLLLGGYRVALAARQTVNSPAVARTWRLAAAACCRALWPFLAGAAEARRAVEVAEAVADGLADIANLREAGEAIRRRRVEDGYCWLDDAFVVAMTCGPVDHAEFAAYELSAADPVLAAMGAGARAMRCFRDDTTGEQAALVHHLRDILGNPFHPVQLDESWLRYPVLALAQVIYREQRFEDLPFLADALEDVGCVDLRILSHCRDESSHTRGCWLLDLLLAGIQGQFEKSDLV
jgi:hypothetical protein